MDTSVRASLLFIAFFLLTAGLYYTRHLMAPFAMAIFIWLVIDTFARWLDDLSPKLPYWLALTIACLTVVASLVGIVVIISDTVQEVVKEAPKYEARLTELLAVVGDVTRQDNLTFGSLNERFGLMDKLKGGIAGFAAAIQGVVGNMALIAIYVIFLFAAQSSFPKKIDDLFPDETARKKAQKVGERIRHSIEKYVGVQTVISLMQTVISYIAMAALGLDNALFWALVIFILNYIPIIGGLAAVAMPSLFALVQYDSSGKALLLAGLLFGAQSIIGNTIQPKMMGDSMNLSGLVVVLSLTLWGALWGGVGAFLSAPLTVIIMIVLAQFPTTRWIAVLLSADGQPDLDPEDKKQEKKKAKAAPSM